MSTPTKSKKKGNKNKYPKTVSSRFSDDWVQRIQVVSNTLSAKNKTTLRKGNVLEICMKSHLPVLEKELGIEVPVSQEATADNV